jgi:catechol 2,3-dioxygenase-like lactoylglutathione lyase family enzyme
MLQGLRTVIYHVSDLAGATTFYTNVVGHAPYFNEPFYVGFNVGGYELGLIPDGDGVATLLGHQRYCRRASTAGFTGHTRE